MLTLAHAGQPPQPHDLWLAWNLSPTLIVGLTAATWTYARGRKASPSRSSADPRRARCFSAAIAVIALALVSPLDALSEALASAHMVQHVLLVLVAAPLLVWSAPTARLLRGAPARLHRPLGRLRGVVSQRRRGLGGTNAAVVLWVLHTATLWFWHAAVPYEAALRNEFVHVIEHVAFLITALLFWHAVIGVRAAERIPQGLGAMLVFGMALQSGFLSLLLTFARSPWYPSYATTTGAWGLDPLADQQLAGVVMWIPAGFVYLGVALALFLAWVRSFEREDVAT